MPGMVTLSTVGGRLGRSWPLSAAPRSFRSMFQDRVTAVVALVVAMVVSVAAIWAVVHLAERDKLSEALTVGLLGLVAGLWQKARNIEKNTNGTNSRLIDAVTRTDSPPPPPGV